MLKPDNKFKFTIEYQWDLLRYTVQDRNGENALNKYDDDYFTLIEHQVIAHSLKTFYKKNKKIPGETMLREVIYSTLNSKEYASLVTKDEQNEILSLVKPLYHTIVEDGDIVYKKCKDFRRHIRVKKLVEDIDINDFTKYDLFLSQLGVALTDEDEDEDYRSSFLLDGIKERQFKRQEKKTIFPTPFKQINQLTNAGGYEKASILVVLDKQKKGKTAMLANAARGYLKMKKKILIVDLENGKDNIFSRLEQGIMRITKSELLSGDYDIQIQKRFRKYRRLGGEIVVLRLPALVTTCDDLQRHIDKLYNKFGFRPDELIIDYAAKMGSISKKDDERNRISDVFLELSNLAIKNDIEHIWTANHVTREGAKARMKTKYVGEDIALCIDIVRHAQAVFGLNRSPEEEEANFFRLEIVEQRDGQPEGRAVFIMDMNTQRADELSTSERKQYDEAFYNKIGGNEGSEPITKKERKDDFRG